MTPTLTWFVTNKREYFQMRYVAAYLLATLGGNKSPSASDIKDILESVGIDVDSERLDVVIKELSGKDIDEVCLLLHCTDAT